MIEVYAFLAMFTVQILAMSVLFPSRLIKYSREQTMGVSEARLAQLYPGVDVAHIRERFLTKYRALTTTFAVLGLLLLFWLFSDAWHADWNENKAEALPTLYFFPAFMLPLLLSTRFVVMFNKEHKLAERKRSASLKRRGLFDFVSPLTVFGAVLCYFLYAAFVIYIEQHPFPGFAGSVINIGAITLVYAANAFALYVTLYGKRCNPFETHAGRLHTIGMAVRGIVYSCIVITVFISLNHSLRLLDLKSWEPFALSIFFAIGAILASMGFAAPLRETDVDRGESPVS